VDERREVAGYLAKYATKSTELAGGVLHRVAEHQVDELPVREHVKAYMREAFTLAEDPALADRRLAATAHAFGYRGHCLTRSRRYSTTFKALREARERHVHEQLLALSDDATQRAIAGATERVASFRFVGQGHLTAGDALLAASAAARAREQRRAAREALCDRPRHERRPDARGGTYDRCAGGVRAVLDGARGRGAAAHRAVHGAALLR
jgi:Replication initiator protein, pSAM2